MNLERAVPTACLSLCLCLGLQACGTVNTTSTRGGPGEDAVAVREDVNDALSRLFLHATEVRVFRNDAGTLEAQVDVANDDFRTRRFLYRFEWLDDRGNVISSRNAVWHSASAPAGGSTVLRSTALTPEATDFRLQVRRY